LDSLLVIGSKDEKLTGFLKKMGYSLRFFDGHVPLPALIASDDVDLVLIDARVDLDAVELCEFLRSDSVARTVPIILLAQEDTGVDKGLLQSWGRVELITIPYSIGMVVGRIAMQLRLRKLAGEDEGTASLAEINARLRDLNERVQKQLEEARALQISLLPKVLPSDDRFDLSIVYQPLEEVGGDWYYAHTTDSGRLALQAADVTGHGLSAAFISALTKLAMVAAGRELPHELLREMNRLISSSLHSDMFVTVFSCLYDPTNGRLDFARAGHPPALLFHRATGEVRQLKSDGFAFGFFAMSDYQHGQERLDPGDLLMIFTDGIPEGSNRGGQNYGYDHMIEFLRNSAPETGSAEVLGQILRDFDEFRDGRLLKDDVTLILLKRVK
jgi:serine phosphatase RsbU (regulator of sigma subunit)